LNGERTKTLGQPCPLREQEVAYGCLGERAVLNAGLLDGLPPLLEELGVDEASWTDLLEALSETWNDDFGRQVAPLIGAFYTPAGLCSSDSCGWERFLSETVTFGLLSDPWQAEWRRAVEVLLEAFSERFRVDATLTTAAWPLPREEEDAQGDPLVELVCCDAIAFVPADLDAWRKAQEERAAEVLRAAGRDESNGCDVVEEARRSSLLPWRTAQSSAWMPTQRTFTQWT